MHVILDQQCRILRFRVTEEVRADEPSVPGPVVLRVGRGMDPDVAAAVADVSLERGLLVGVEHVAGRRQEHDRVVGGEL